MFIEMTDDEMINFNYVATIRKGYSKTYNSFTIYVNTIGEDNVVLQFETEEEMEKKWRWLQHIVPRLAYTSEMAEFKVLAVEAIEKQIPKKPIKSDKEIRYCEVWECPSCGFEWSSRVVDYCYRCGQRIDWGDER